MEIHMVDIIILAGILISVLVGYIRGFVHELLSMASIVVSSILSINYAPKIFSMFATVIANEMSAKIISYISCFAISIILFSILTNVCNNLIKGTSFKNLDRLFGSLFGFARGVIIFCIIEMFVTNIASNYDVTYQAISSKSYFYKYIYKTSNIITIILPSSISEYVIKSVDDARRTEILSTASSNNVKFHNIKKLVATRNMDTKTARNNNANHNSIAKLVPKRSGDIQITQDRMHKINKTISDIMTEYVYG